MNTKGHPIRVLLIDDEQDGYAIVRDLLSELSSSQFILKWVSDHGTALDAVISGEFDVCLLDCGFGERIGLEFMREASRWDAAIPIVFLTGGGSPDPDFEAMGRGAACCLTKDDLNAALLERSILEAMERHRKKEDLIRAKRVIQALSECNHAVIHIDDEMELLRAVCRIVVEVGGYGMAWVGYAGEDSTTIDSTTKNSGRTITPVAQYGPDKDCLEMVGAAWRDAGSGMGPEGACICTGLPVIMRAADSRAEAAPLSGEALKRGYVSLAGLPLFLDGQRLGALIIYSSETDAFDMEELEFLVKLSGNLSYGIGVLRLRKSQRQAEDALKEANLNLERRVEERTAELVKVNAQLGKEAGERRQVEDALRRGEGRLRRAELVSRSGNWEFDLGTGRMNASEGAKIVYGLEGSDWFIPEVQKIPLPEYRGMLDRALRELIEEGKPYNVEFKIRRPADGQIADIHSIAEYSPESGVVFGIIQDITERRQAEEALKEGELKFRAIFDQTFQLMGLLTVDGTVITINRNALEFVQTRDSDVKGKPFWQTPWWTHSAEQQDKLRAAVKKAAAGELVRFEATHLSADGVLHCVDFSIKPIMDETGAVSLLIAEARDINERKRAEEALHDNEARRKLAMDLAGLVHWEYHVKTGMFSFDDQFYALYGTTSEQEGGPLMSAETYARRFLRPEDSHLVAKAIAKTLATTDPDYIGQVEHVIVRADGEERYIVVRSEVVRDHTGRIVRTRGANQDITERKRAEEALKEGERRFRAIFDQTFQFMGLLTVDGRVLEANRNALEFVRAKASDIIGKPFWETPWWAYSEEQRDALRAAVKKAAAGEFMRFEVAHYSADGVLHSMDFSLKPIMDETGAVSLLIAEARDVNEAKRAEEALKASETRLRAIADSARDAILMMDPEGRITFWNPAAESILGYTAEEAGGRNMHELIAPERYHAAYHGAFPGFVETGRGEAVGKTLELVARRKDGKEIPVELSLSAVFMNGWCAVGLLRDITARKQDEEALKESRQQLANIIDFLPDPTFVIDNVGGVIAWNKAIEEMTGVKAPDMLGKGNYEYAVPFYGERRPILIDLVCNPQEEAFSKYLSVGKGGAEITGEANMPALRAGTTYLYGTASVLRDSAGNIVGAIESIRDITESKRAEEALRESEERFSSIFRASPVGTTITHLSNGRFADVNDAWLSLFGYARDEVVGKDPLELGIWVDPEDRKKTVELLQTQGMIRDAEMQFRRKSGEIVDVLASGEVIELAGTRYMLGLMHDITERKRTEEALRESEERFSSFFRTSPVGTTITSLSDGRIADVNDAWLGLFGYTRDEIVGKAPLELGLWVDPEDRVNTLELLQRQGRVRDFELQFRRKSGEILDVLGSAEVIELAGTRYMLGLVHDITERKRAEEALRESEDRFSSFFRASPVGTTILRLAGNRFTDVNDAFLELLGYTREEVIGSGPLEMGIWVDPEDRKKMIDLLQMHGGVRDFETRFCRKSGDIIDVHFSAEVIELAGISYVLGLTHDITERKMAEEALRESEKRFYGFFRATPVGTSITRLSDGRYVDVNDAWLGLFGYSREEVVGRNPLDLGMWVDPEDRGKLLEVLQERGRMQDFETRFRRKSGEVLDVLASAEVIELAGVNYILGLTHDITERRRALEALERSEWEKTILNEIANVFLTSTDDKMYEEVLEVILKALNCRHGIFGYIGDDGELIIPSLTREMWSECRVEGKSIVFPPHVWGDSIWGEAIKERKPFSSDGPFKIPPGHLHVYNFLTVPVVFMDKTIGLTSAANKEGGFTSEDKAILERIAGSISPILNARLQRDRQELERKRAEEALRESETSLRQIIDLVPHKIFVKDQDGKYLLANKMCAEFYDTTAGELIGKCHADFHPDEGQLQNMLRDDREVMTKGESKFIAEEPFTDARGNLHYLQTTKVPFHTPGNGTPAVLGVSMDITGIKRAGEVLRESEAKYRLISENTGDVIWQYDLNAGRYAYISPSIRRILGYAPEEIVGQSMGRFLSDESRRYVKKRLPEIIAALAAGDESARVTSHNLELLHKDGSIVHTEVVATLLEDAESRACALVGVSRDITEKLHAEEVLRESEAKYRLISENTGDVIWQYNLDADRFVYVSPSSQQLTGYVAEECQGQTMEAFITPESMQYVRKALPKFIMALTAGDESARVSTHQVDMLRKDGSVVHSEVVTTLLQNEEGRVCGLVGVSRDITEQLRAEEALRESERRFRALFDAMMEGVAQHEMVYDERGMPVDYRFVSTNPAFEKHTGLKSEEVIGQLGSKIFGLGKAAHLQRFARVASSGRPDSFETYSPHLDRHFDISVTSPKQGSFVTVFENITERKHAEEERKALEARLAHAQKLEAIGTLAGGIAHDFNNILQPMMGYTEMALNALDPSNPLRNNLAQVLNASLRARDLVRQILAISRSTQEQLRIPTDISSIIKEALKLLRCSLPTSIEVRQNIQRGIALADATQIHQVLMNLCTNAAHAMDNQGVLEVRLAPVDLSESDLAAQPAVDLKPGPYMKLSVSDTGCGMNAETMERVFDPYFTTKEVGKGSGLGLAVVHGIVKRHEGAVSVTSTPGKGTMFCIYIPRTQMPPPDHVETPQAVPTGTESILLVDDDTAVLEMGTAILEQLGYKVTALTGSVQALEVFTAGPEAFDLIITDYTMPKLTGMDIVKEVRRVRPDMPVVLCTGFSEKVTNESMRDLGIELLMKPYGLVQISEVVRRVLDG